MSDRTANAATDLLLGRIPVEGVLHKRILITFGNIIRNINSVERDIAYRQLHCRVPDKEWSFQDGGLYIVKKVGVKILTIIVLYRLS